ncbi:MAG: SMP-30/gluconolactonase/LRE family protein [Microbacterium sp.]
MGRTFEVLVSGVGFTEGPVFTQNGEVIFVSPDRGTLYAVSDRGPEVFANVGGAPVGATEGADGAIYITQSPKRKSGSMTGGIQRIRDDSFIEWVSMDPISPNDLCFGPDGHLWVTDPTWHRPGGEYDSRLWRIDVETEHAELVLTADYYANGIGFSLEDDVLYVADTQNKRILRYSLHGHHLGEPEVFAQTRNGVPDGFAFDAEGNLMVAVISTEPPGDSAHGTLQVFDRSGTLAEMLEPRRGRVITNVAIGPDGRVVAANPHDRTVRTPGRAPLAIEKGAIIQTMWDYPGLALHPFRR